MRKHNFTRNSNELSHKFGKYNGGFVYVKNDQNGKKFLRIWSNLCKNWCEFNSKQGKFSDQKYLEDLSTTPAWMRLQRQLTELIEHAREFGIEMSIAIDKKDLKKHFIYTKKEL